jgi:hypothetical protein
MQRKRYLVIAVIVAIAVPVLIILALTAANYPPVVESLLARPDKVFPWEVRRFCVRSRPLMERHLATSGRPAEEC